VSRARAADSPRPALNHAISNVYSKDLQKLLKHKYMDNVTDIVFFTVWKIYFLLFLALDMNNKNVLRRHGTGWRRSFHFRHVTNKIMFTLLVDLARSDRHDFICNFANISCGLRLMK